MPTPTSVASSWRDPVILGTLKTIGPRLALAAGGSPLTIRLLNSAGDVRNEVRIDAPEVQVGKTNVVTYSAETSAQDARALGSALQSLGFFKDRGGTVALAKSGDRPSISFSVRDSA